MFLKKRGEKETHGQVKTGQLVKNVIDMRNRIGFRSDNRYRCISLCANVY